MNDVIEKLTSFVESQYVDKAKPSESKFNINIKTSNDTGNNLSWSEVNKVPNNTEIHNALNEVFPEVDKIANQPFEFPPLEEDNHSSPKSIKQIFKRPIVERDYHTPTPQSRINQNEFDGKKKSNIGIYRIWRDKNFGSCGNTLSLYLYFSFTL